MDFARRALAQAWAQALEVIPLRHATVDQVLPALRTLIEPGGTIGGQVICESDKIGAYPVSTAYHPSDLGATIYSALGVNPSATIRDTFGRPLRLNEGSLIRPLVTAAS